MKKNVFLLLLLLITTITISGKNPKYVFYFIGDGMGPSHVHGTEMMLGEIQGVIGRPNKLTFTQFPSTAFVTTFSARNGVTDSAASGTALATGKKTVNGFLGVTPDSMPINSIAFAAKEAGYKVGLVTTVGINHATPAAFYAHQPGRGLYYEIGKDMIKAGYDFYGGGDLIATNQQREEIYQNAVAQGYTIARGYEEFREKRGESGKMMLYQKEVSTELPYALDRSEDDLTLEQLTRAGIEQLTKNNKKGFFFMVEGGKIDYASHANDAATAFAEVIEMDNAIKAALEFYKKHPTETLIIVTADHETGGLVLGYSGAYALRLNILTNQRVSAERLASMLRRESRKQKLEWNDVKETLTTLFGFWEKVSLSSEETHSLRALYEQAYSTNEASEREKKLNELATKAKSLINSKSLISWAGPNHSGSYVPLFAIGNGSNKFNGVIDNTDIPMIIEKVAGY